MAPKPRPPDQIKPPSTAIGLGRARRERAGAAPDGLRSGIARCGDGRPARDCRDDVCRPVYGPRRMLDPEITAVLAQLSEVAARNTVGAIQTRVATAKATKQHENTVNELTEIINQPVEDRVELVGIATTLRDQLVAQRITTEEITYITDKLIPTVEDLAGACGGRQCRSHRGDQEVGIGRDAHRASARRLQLQGGDRRAVDTGCGGVDPAACAEPTTPAAEAASEAAVRHSGSASAGARSGLNLSGTDRTRQHWRHRNPA